jgi:hypothetical protein
MWTWIISANGRRIAVWGLICIAGFIGVQWYGNKQWTKGVEEGFIKAATEIERLKKAEWAEREREIAAKEAEANQRLETLTQATQAVHAARATLIRNFDITLKELESDRVESYRFAGAVADADLIAELRAISGTLAGYADTGGTSPDTRPAP